MHAAAPDDHPRRRTGGRSARVREAVLKAVLETLVEGGPDAVTMSEIARRAGVHATSVQRRWGSREKLVLDALLTYSREQLPIPDTGRLRDDLVALAGSLARYLDTPLGQALSRTMAVADDDIALAAERDRFWRERYDAACVVVQRAVDRHELDAQVDMMLVVEMLIAPLHFRTLLTRQPVDAELITRIVGTLERGVLPASRQRGSADDLVEDR